MIFFLPFAQIAIIYVSFTMLFITYLDVLGKPYRNSYTCIESSKKNQFSKTSRYYMNSPPENAGHSIHRFFELLPALRGTALHLCVSVAGPSCSNTQLQQKQSQPSRQLVHLKKYIRFRYAEL